jgi:hypothetical protein
METIITENNICIYREIYYETVKPMIRSGKTQEEIDLGVNYMCEEYGIKPDLYHALSTIDLLQRISEMKKGSDRINYKVNNEELVVENFSNIPQLRCPRRTEQKFGC